MKKILMMIHTMGTLLPTDNDRYTYLANRLLEEGMEVEIVTSDYEHHKKRYRNPDVAKAFDFKITFLHENEYKKNLSFERILGHISFARRLKQYLAEHEKPDIVYCAVPPIISAYIIAKFTQKNNIKLMVDIQDLWPEAMVSLIGKNVFTECLFWPLKKMANVVYSSADYLVAVSETFLSRGKQVNMKAKGASVYLGTDSTIVDAAIHKNMLEKPENEIWICYIGNFGNNYDFLHLFKALQILSQKGYSNLKMMMIGDGDKRKEIEEYRETYFKNTYISGYLPYDEMLDYLFASDIAVNPINAGTASSVTNKVGDYAAAGVPVINAQDNPEYMNLVEEYAIGYNAIPENEIDIAKQLEKLLSDSKHRKQMGLNNRKLYEEKFDRRITNRIIIDYLKE